MKTYLIKKTNLDNVPISSLEWEKAEDAIISLPAPGSEYSPVTVFKALYSQGGITVKMETDEKPLLARKTERDGDICLDSCMEMFIRPETSEEYLNFEINPLGTLHLGFGKDRYGRKHFDIKSEVFKIECTFENDKWQLKYYIPFSVLEDIYGSYTDVFYGNFYKCGEETEKIHFLTWNEVKTEKADFHRPEYFGKIILEK